MSETRNDHYVPQWHQEVFFEPGRNKLAYLDRTPEKKLLSDGRVITFNDRFTNPTSLCFRQNDLYSIFFGTNVFGKSGAFASSVRHLGSLQCRRDRLSVDRRALDVRRNEHHSHQTSV
jgi:hypothetical protein